MEKAIQNLIYTASILSIKPTLRFSRHRLENLQSCCLGHITTSYYK
nr:MAG TPA: hypothetical protein [Caudoviricetes sp.]